MRFHLIDRLDCCEPARSIRARKLTARCEEYWEDSESGPVMPPSLVLESLCQAGAWLIILSTGQHKRAALLSIGSVRFLADVRPGDVLAIEGTVDSMNEEVAALSGRITVAGRAVLEAQEIMCLLVDAGDLEDPAETALMERVLRRAAVLR